jgi:hypothetical protein
MVFPLFWYSAYCVEREGLGAREVAKKWLVDSFWLPTVLVKASVSNTIVMLIKTLSGPTTANFLRVGSGHTRSSLQTTLVQDNQEMELDHSWSYSASMLTMDRNVR